MLSNSKYRQDFLLFDDGGILAMYLDFWAFLLVTRIVFPLFDLVKLFTYTMAVACR